MAKTTMTVSPIAAFTPVIASVVPVVSLAAVPALVALMVLRMLTINAPEDAETFPAASVAVAVMLSAPALTVVVVVML